MTRKITFVSTGGSSHDATVLAAATNSRGVRFVCLRVSSYAGGQFLGYFFETLSEHNGQWVRGGPHVPSKAIGAIRNATPGDRIKASGRWWDVGDPMSIPSRLVAHRPS